MTLAPNRPWTLVLSTEDTPEVRGEEALLAAHGHDADVVRAAGGDRLSPFIRQLVIAADAFIVRRDAVAQGESDPLAEGEGRSIVAGYPWFNDWGRDTMIALPGLTLATGRSAEAAAILRAFGRWVVGGLLPNDFPSIAGVTPEYNTVDAALWYIQALRAYHDATGDDALRDELLPVVRAIVEAHIGGTLHGIGVDHADGLLRAGEPGLALTWMDARVDDWVVTARMGKPVEVNALWYNALVTVGSWLQGAADAATGQTYMTLAEQVAKSFRKRFWRPELGYLADVVDGPEGDDLALRPNQVFALSLHFALLEGDQARSALDAVGRALHTSLRPAHARPGRRRLHRSLHGGPPGSRRRLPPGHLLGVAHGCLRRGDRAGHRRPCRGPVGPPPVRGTPRRRGPGFDLGDLRRRCAPPAARLPGPGVVGGRSPARLAPPRAGVARE